MAVFRVFESFLLKEKTVPLPSSKLLKIPIKVEQTAEFVKHVEQISGIIHNPDISF